MTALHIMFLNEYYDDDDDEANENSVVTETAPIDKELTVAFSNSTSTLDNESSK